MIHLSARSGMTIESDRKKVVLVLDGRPLRDALPGYMEAWERGEAKQWLAKHEVIPRFPPHIQSDLIEPGPNGDTLPLTMAGLQVLGFGGNVCDAGGSPSKG
jgi:hypothetical protein